MLPSTIAATDYHTGGEPFRIVADPPVPIPGRTVAERRARAIEDAAVQGLRAVHLAAPTTRNHGKVLPTSVGVAKEWTGYRSPRLMGVSYASC